MRAIGVKVAAIGLMVLIGIGSAVAQHGSPLGVSRKERGDQGELAGRGTDAHTETRVERKPIPFETRYELSRTVGAGRLVKREDGQPGAIVNTYAVKVRNGVAISKELVKTERIEPKDALVLIGRQGFTPSRGSFTRTKVLDMHASAYDPSAGRGKAATGRTASGRRATYGVVAVDTRVIPMGTILYIEGYGLAIAADRGSAIKGNKIDLCYPTRSQALRWGRQSVKVHVLK